MFRVMHIEHPDGGRSLVTLADIAQAAGVSIATVSKVLRGIDVGTSAATRSRIQATAERLGYRRNLLVEGMQTGRSLTIGVVIPPYGEFTRRLADAIHGRCLTHGLVPIFHWAPPTIRRSDPAEAEAEDAADERAVLDRLLDRRVDGVLLYPAADGALTSQVHVCQAQGIPVVAMDRCPEPGVVDFIGTDDAAGARLAAEHLLARGHRRILIMGGEARYASYRTRTAVVAATVQAAGGHCTIAEVPNADLDNLMPHARRLLAEDPTATAIALGTDVFAPAVYRAAQEAGRAIPGALAVVGFAGLSLGSCLRPTLTTVAQDPESLGSLATDRLQERLRSAVTGSRPWSILLQPHLEVRNSTGGGPS